MPLRPPAGFISAFYDPLRNPNAPTIGTATGGDLAASVAFTAPANYGGSVITQFEAISTPQGIIGSAASSPVTVEGLSAGTSYTFAVWATNTYGPSAYSAASNSATPTATRGVMGGLSIWSNVMNYITIATTGNATDFGALITFGTGGPDYAAGGVASSTRGIFAGGRSANPFDLNIIQYITIATTGNATDFGDLLAATYGLTGCSNSTRGLFAGGIAGSATNVIQYITIATVGNATDFGDLSSTRSFLSACASTTRGVFGGGQFVNIIEYVTIATTGNTTDFGDLTVARDQLAACSSATRGLFGGGRNNLGTPLNVIDYITIATTGNATDFGDLTQARGGAGGCSSSTRGVFSCGASSNTIDYVTISTTGNAVDFGDTLQTGDVTTALSNGHGGLS